MQSKVRIAVRRCLELKDDNSVLLDNNRPESLIYLELEWKPFTVGIIIR